MSESKGYSDHVHQPYNRRGNIKLGFDTEEEYHDFCKFVIELYEENEDMSMNGVCKYVQRELGIKLYRPKLKNIFDFYNVKPRGPRKKRRTRAIRITSDVDDYEYLEQLNNTFEGSYMKREFGCFCLHVVRGKPTPHLLLYLSEYKTVVFMYDKRVLKYHLLGENLSKVEESVLEELLAEVEEVDSLDPVKAYAHQKGLQYYGDNDE